MAVGIKQIAETAGVSTATVSHVINHTRFVSEETTRKVEKAMEELSYSPNYLAKMLKEKKSNMIGLVIPDISNFFFTEIAAAVEKKLSGSGYNLVLCSSDEDPEKEKEKIAHILTYIPAGIIIAPTDRTCDYKGLLGNLPAVYVDRKVERIAGDSVRMDSRSAVSNAVGYLIASGHSEIGFIGGVAGISTTDERYQGYISALLEAGLKPDPSLISFGDSRIQSGYDSCRILIERNRNMSALFVSNNLMCIGAMKYLVQHSIRVPEDISIIGFDDYDWTEITNPALSTIKQPADKMGEIAASLLLSRIADPDKPIEEIVLDGRLVLRNSCIGKNLADIRTCSE